MTRAHRPRQHAPRPPCATASSLPRAQYDGIFLSNGPGDPTMCVSTVEQLQKVIALEGRDLKPIFGICMGNQLMGLAAGCSASKMPFGNRGQNQVRVACSCLVLHICE